LLGKSQGSIGEQHAKRSLVLADDAMVGQQDAAIERA